MRRTRKIPLPDCVGVWTGVNGGKAYVKGFVIPVKDIRELKDFGTVAQVYPQLPTAVIEAVLGLTHGQITAIALREKQVKEKMS